MVEVTRLELATSRSLTVRATNLRYTSIDIIVPHLFEKIKRIVADFYFNDFGGFSVFYIYKKILLCLRLLYYSL